MNAMKGYQLSFITTQAHRHAGRSLAEWLVHVAKEMGLAGATVIPASEGFGKHGRIHSAHFFELASTDPRPSSVGQRARTRPPAGR